MKITRQAKEATRARILRAARELFVRRGFEPTTTRELATRSGIAAGTLFNYFPNKETLAATLLREAQVRAHDELREKLRGNEPLAEALFLLVIGELRQLERPEPKAKELAPPVEHFGYSANPLLEGQACYRAGQYERGIDLLEELDSVEAKYWLGRCLERAGHLERAAEVYRAVVSAEDGGSFTERARTNLDFVEWKLRFSSTLGESPKQ